MHTSKKVAATVAAGVMVALAGAAQAFERSDSFQVTVTVETNCTITAGDMNFGTFLGDTNLTAQSTISVACTNNTPYTVALSAGSSGDYTGRTVVNGTDELVYNLYTDGTYGTVWGDGNGVTGVVPGIGAGLAASQTLDVYGRLLVADNTAGVAVGVYTDTVTATVIY